MEYYCLSVDHSFSRDAWACYWLAKSEGLTSIIEDAQRYSESETDEGYSPYRAMVPCSLVDGLKMLLRKHSLSVKHYYRCVLVDRPDIYVVDTSHMDRFYWLPDIKAMRGDRTNMPDSHPHRRHHSS